MIKSQKRLCTVLVLNKGKVSAAIQLIIQFRDFSEVKDLEGFYSLVCIPKLG